MNSTISEVVSPTDDLARISQSWSRRASFEHWPHMYEGIVIGPPP